MFEGNIRRYFCGECSTEIFRKSNLGSPPRYCGPCAKDRQRARIRDYCRRKRAGIKPSPTFTCISCSGVFPRVHRTNMPPSFCGDCFRKKETERGSLRSSERMAALRLRFETEGRWTSCETCGTDIRCRRQKGPARRFCDECAYRRRLDLEKAVRPWAWRGICPRCGSVDGRTGRDGRPMPCAPCLDAARDGDTGRWLSSISAERQADAKIYGASAVRLRGPWDDQFTYLDIFRRDGWICQVCRKRVKEALRSPDPMSPSADHLIPRSQGGLDLRANVRLAHRGCNSSRNNRGGNEQLMLVG